MKFFYCYWLLLVTLRSESVSLEKIAGEGIADQVAEVDFGRKKIVSGIIGRVNILRRVASGNTCGNSLNGPAHRNRGALIFERLLQMHTPGQKSRSGH